jgi:membrane fusion protein, heavy metal efflux system
MLVWLLGASCSCSKSDHKPAAPPVTEQKSAAPAPASTSAVVLCEHKLPGDLCTKCNPELAEVFKEKGDWCAEHGVPESQCLKCNPGLDFTKASAPTAAADWCGEHGVPESMCTKCKPQLVATFVAKGDFCREHGFPESVCPICNPEKVRQAGHEPPVFPKPGTKIKLASAETEKEIGIVAEAVSTKPFARSVDVVGQLSFNENRLARLAARGDGVVVDVKVDIGDDVKRGEPLVTLASGSVGLDQSKIVASRARVETARATFEREKALMGSGISSRRAVEEARAELAAAEGDQAAARAALRATGASEGGGGRYTLVAPFAGTVVSRHAVAGQTVSPSQTIVEVADLSTVWALLDVPEDKAGEVQSGQKVRIKLEASGREIAGVVSRVDAALDTRTRTVRARVELPNPKRDLRAGVFVRAQIEVAAPQGALLVPREAVQEAEGQKLVFVRSGPGQYDPRRVDVGPSRGSEVVIAKGLSAGEHVVTAGAFVLKTEILKDSIGAGCVDD